jgi:hypothetical protein
MNSYLGRAMYGVLLALSVPFLNTLQAATGPATIIDVSGGCDSSTTERTNLAAALTSAGYTVTTITTGVVPSDLTGQKQVWDIRCTSALTGPESMVFTAYLVSGGSLFLMGENTSFAAARDATLISYISAVGGGSLTLTATANSQTAQPPFTGPTTLSTVNYRAVGGTRTAGTGAFVTTDTSGYGGAIVFGPGSLSSAPSGTLIIVWDVNFMDGSRSAGEIALLNNLIAYLAAPVPIGVPIVPTVPALSASSMVVLSLLLGCAGSLLLRRRFA